MGITPPGLLPANVSASWRPGFIKESVLPIRKDRWSFDGQATGQGGPGGQRKEAIPIYIPLKNKAGVIRALSLSNHFNHVSPSYDVHGCNETML